MDNTSTQPPAAVYYDEGPNGDSIEFPWCVIQDGGVSDRYATELEATAAADELNAWPAAHLSARIDGDALLNSMIVGLARIVEGHAREIADGTALLPARNARMIRTHGETLHAWIAAKVTP